MFCLLLWYCALYIARVCDILRGWHDRHDVCADRKRTTAHKIKSKMCKGWKNRNASKEESEVIARIIEEFYDPEVTLLSEDELEDIIREYGDNTYKVDKVEENYFDDGILGRVL